VQFHEWPTQYELAKVEDPMYGNESPLHFYNRLSSTVEGGLLNRDPREITTCVLSMLESNWYFDCRPYYKTWPSIINALLRLRLDISLSELQIPRRTLLLRCPVGKEPDVNGFLIRGILSAYGCTNTENKALLLLAAFVRHKDSDEKLLLPMPALPNVLDLTIEQFIDKIGRAQGCYDAVLGPDNAREVITVAVKMVLTCYLLDNDPSIITPDVLSKDTERYSAETDEDWKRRAEERARRRGKVGWNIGAEYETCPHYRRPHFGIRHTGTGRKVPRIVPIKGSVVHRSRLTDVPTGYILPDGTEVEDIHKTPDL
jgi:hypothetical protein